MKKKIVRFAIVGCIISAMLTGCGVMGSPAADTINSEKKSDKITTETTDEAETESADVETWVTEETEAVTEETEAVIDNEPVATKSIFEMTDEEVERYVYDGMTAEEWQAEEEKFRAQSDKNWKEYEEAKESALDRNESGEVVVPLKGISIVYAGEAEINTISSTTNPNFIMLVSNMNNEDYISVGISNKDNTENFDSSYDAIVSKNHENKTESGKVYYTAQHIDGKSKYYTLPSEDKGFVVVMVSGNMNIDDVDLRFDK